MDEIVLVMTATKGQWCRRTEVRLVYNRRSVERGRGVVEEFSPPSFTGDGSSPVPADVPLRDKPDEEDIWGKEG